MKDETKKAIEVAHANGFGSDWDPFIEDVSDGNYVTGLWTINAGKLEPDVRRAYELVYVISWLITQYDYGKVWRMMHRYARVWRDL